LRVGSAAWHLTLQIPECRSSLPRLFPARETEYNPGLPAQRGYPGLRMNTLSFSFPRRFGTAAGFASGCPKTNSAPMVSRTQGRPRCAGQPWAVLRIPFGELSGAKSARWDPPSEFKLCGLGRGGPGERRRWGERASLRVGVGAFDSRIRVRSGCSPKDSGHRPRLARAQIGCFPPRVLAFRERPLRARPSIHYAA